MSLFLGPVHFWLYDKIKNQEALTSLIAEHFDKGAEYTKQLPPLEEVIDEGNIHGWLQSQITDAETRYASLVSVILNENENALDEIKKVAYDFGRQNSLNENTDAENAYQAFNDFFVNGMPCDRVNMIVCSDVNSLRFKETADVHSQYWNGDSSVYYQIRNEIMRGMLDGTSIKLKVDTDSYVLIKE